MAVNGLNPRAQPENKAVHSHNFQGNHAITIIYTVAIMNYWYTGPEIHNSDYFRTIAMIVVTKLKKDDSYVK